MCSEARTGFSVCLFVFVYSSGKWNSDIPTQELVLVGLLTKPDQFFQLQNILSVSLNFRYIDQNFFSSKRKTN